MGEGKIPDTFWYFYPNGKTATEEFRTKWRENLPTGPLKDHPQYGWQEPNYSKKIIQDFTFNNGVKVIFCTYEQQVSNLQSGTVYGICFDEELPFEFLSEIIARLTATNGKLRGVFTATKGQLHWRKAIEGKGKTFETHKDALKIQVGLKDCQYYDDGTPSKWTDKEIAKRRAKYPTLRDQKIRIDGKFAVADGLMYEAFDHEKNTCEIRPIPPSWEIYGGVDTGSGGTEGSQSSHSLHSSQSGLYTGARF